MAEILTGFRGLSASWQDAVHSILLRASRRINFLVFHGSFLLYYIILSIVALGLIPIMLLNQCDKNILLFMKSLKHLTKIFGISWELRDGAILRQEHKGVIVANHQSNLDLVGLTNIWHLIGNCSMTAKKELVYVWPFGVIGWLTGTCFLDRRNPKAAWKSLEQSAKQSFGKKAKLWMFPEGTRNRKGQTLLPFKKGPFHMAIAGQVPLLPVIFAPYYFVDEKKFTRRGGGKTVVQALPPIPTRGLTMDDLDDLMARTRHVMQTAFDALSEEVGLTLDAPNL